MSAFVYTISAVDAVLRAAALLLPVREATAKNDGRFVNAIQASTGNGTGDAWCQSMTYYVGRGVLGSDWPMPATASCHVALTYARRKGWTLAAGERPQRGDQGFVLNAEGRAHHTFFVEAVDADGRMRTIEGNTNDDGSREGIGQFRRTRGAAHDRTRYEFARWTRGLPGAAPTAPAVRIAA